jgi:uncharacterized protein YndB with AHSA1/START domain
LTAAVACGILSSIVTSFAKEDVMNQRPYDFYTHSASIHVDASPDRVWAVVGDLGTSADWAGSGQVLSIRQTSDGPVGVGTVYEAQEKIGAKFKSLSKITGYEPNKQISWVSAPTPMKNAPNERWHLWTVTLTPEDGGTRVTQDVHAARAAFPMRIFQLIGLLTSGGTGVIDRGMDRTLQNIKERAERTAPVGA